MSLPLKSFLPYQLQINNLVDYPIPLHSIHVMGLIAVCIYCCIILRAYMSINRASTRAQLWWLIVHQLLGTLSLGLIQVLCYDLFFFLSFELLRDLVALNALNSQHSQHLEIFSLFFIIEIFNLYIILLETVNIFKKNMQHFPIKILFSSYMQGCIVTHTRLCKRVLKVVSPKSPK